MTDAEKITVLIVDDSAQARKLLRLMLKEQAADFAVADEAANLPEAIALIRKIKPDVVFLDIEMPGKSGLQILDELPRNEVNYDIVFTTAYNEYALKAFRLSAIDYLLKPIHENHLAETIQRIRERKEKGLLQVRLDALASNLSREKEELLCIPVMNGYEYLKIADIEYIEADGSYARIVDRNGRTTLVSKNLKYFEMALADQKNFLRVHRSFLINLAHQKAFSRSGRGTITMNSGREIDLARDRREAFFKAAGIN
jgi:two-component system, LytTR family, response regulator